MNERERLLQLVRQRSLIYGDITLSSGKKSHYYIDGKQTTLHSEGIALISRLMLPQLRGVDAVGGLTLGADPFIGALLVACHDAGRPIVGFIVRKEAKGHGTQKLIEGPLKKGMRVAIVEDVVTTAAAALKAADAVEEAGAHVVRVLALLDRQEGGAEAVRARGYEFAPLFTKEDLKIRPA